MAKKKKERKKVKLGLWEKERENVCKLTIPVSLDISQDYFTCGMNGDKITLNLDNEIFFP